MATLFENFRNDVRARRLVRTTDVLSDTINVTQHGFTASTSRNLTALDVTRGQLVIAWAGTTPLYLNIGAAASDTAFTWVLPVNSVITFHDRWAAMEWNGFATAAGRGSVSTIALA